MLTRMLRRVPRIGFLAVLLVGFIESCPVSLQDGWKQLSVEKRAKASQVVAVGKAVKVRVDRSWTQVTKEADFQFLEVIKGKNITDKINAMGGDYLFSIYGFGSAAQCRSPVAVNETYLLFLILEPKTMSLVAAYESVLGATDDPSKENVDRIYESLGWKPWTSWSSCSVSCGGGLQTRTRICSARQCDGSSSENRDCNKYNCKGVKNLLNYFFKLGRNPRSIPTPRHRNAYRITNTGNLSVPTHRIYWNAFPEDFSIFASAKYINYTNGYLISFYDSRDRLQIGIKISKTSVALEYLEAVNNSVRQLAFNVEVVDHGWHQFAFSVQNGAVSFYLDCTSIGTKNIKRDSTVDTNGNAYLSGKTAPPQARGSNIEFYITELSISENAGDGEEQCVNNELYPPKESDLSSGSGEDPTDEIEYEWSPWGSCSHICGEHGVRRRVKMCKRPLKNPSDTKCLEMLQVTDKESCNRKECKAYCQPSCMNGGECFAKNKCRCKPGYYGISCEKAVTCKLKCANGGRCIASLGTCKCPKGFGGKYCRKESCYPPCENGGICLKGVCKCRRGYVPPLCKPSCFPPCKNKGVCVMPGRCRCKTGYYGSRCELTICTKVCLNGGRCYNRNKCNCKSGWTGDTCTTAVCHPKCLNGGHCQAPNLCSCPNHTSGTYCQYVVCYPRCLNGGICMKGNKCICSQRYKGTRCETPLCNPRCKNGGECVAANQCLCPSGFFGSSCERSSTEENPPRSYYYNVFKKVLPSFVMEAMHTYKD